MIFPARCAENEHVGRPMNGWYARRSLQNMWVGLKYDQLERASYFAIADIHARGPSQTREYCREATNR